MGRRKSLGGLTALMVLSVAAIGALILIVSLLDSGDTPVAFPRIQDDPTPLIRIEGKDITRFHVNVGHHYEKTRAGKSGYAQPEHGILLRFVEMLSWEEILRRHHKPLTPDAISEERARQIRESRDRDKMREILDALDPYPGMFELLMVRPSLANKWIYQLHGEKPMQVEAFDQAERSLKEAIREPDDFFRRMKEQDPKTYRRIDSRKPMEGMGPDLPNAPVPHPQAEVDRTRSHILTFAKKWMSTLTIGDVCPTVVDAEGSYLVLRLLERTSEHVVYEVVGHPKSSFDAWFDGELKKLKGEVVDPATREVFRKNLPEGHKYRKWLLAE